MMKVLDNAGCKLGEGALWHPKLKQLFWFDILNAKLYSHSSDTAYCWTFDEMVSAAGWVDEEQLIIASERALLCFNIRSGELNELVPLEADNKVTRSNDGRADPWGGFWIGTMGKKAEPGAGAIYRYFNGELQVGFRYNNQQCYLFCTGSQLCLLHRYPDTQSDAPTA